MMEYFKDGERKKEKKKRERERVEGNKVESYCPFGRRGVSMDGKEHSRSFHLTPPFPLLTAKPLGQALERCLMRNEASTDFSVAAPPFIQSIQKEESVSSSHLRYGFCSKNQKLVPSVYEF